MNRAIIPISLALFVLVVFACATGEHSPDMDRSIPISSRIPHKAHQGCPHLHAGLLGNASESHFKVLPEGVKYCLVCHSTQGPAPAFAWVIHRDHYAKEEFTGDCWSCHLIDAQGNFKLHESDKIIIEKTNKEEIDKLAPFYRSWGSSEYLDHTHAEQSVTCALCHKTTLPEERVAMEQCLKCHGSYQYLTKLTEDVSPNPHASHCGEISCTLCHQVHAESEFYCNLCHAFNIKTP